MLLSLSPISFNLLSTGGCFLSLVLGADWIAYLLSLSNSKLPPLSVLRWEQTFPSLLSSCRQHSTQSLPPRPPTSPPLPYCMRSVVWHFCPCFFFILDTFFVSLLFHSLTPLSFLPLFTVPFPPGQTAAVCNILRRTPLCPPPCQILYWSVSLIQRVDLSKYSLKGQKGSQYSSDGLALTFFQSSEPNRI